MKTLKEQQYEINLRLEEHTRADESYDITVSTVLNLARNALPIFKSSETYEKNTLLKFLLQNSVVDGRKLSFELKKPFDLALNIANGQKENRAHDPVHPIWLGD